MAPKTFAIGLRVTGFCNQGARKYMEDMYSIGYCSSKKGLDYVFLGVFDGHGGNEAANYVNENLMKSIIKDRLFWSSNKLNVLRAIRKGFIHTNNKMREAHYGWPKTKSSYSSISGTTATTIFLKQNKMFLGHVGDSKLVLGYSQGNKKDQLWIPKVLTVLHSPDDTHEAKRIVESGGKVVKDKSDVARVVWKRPVKNAETANEFPADGVDTEELPFLSLSRSIGDFWSYCPRSKKYIISSEPDVNVLHISPQICKCLILGSHGLWNVLSPSESVKMVYDIEKLNNLNMQNENIEKENYINPSQYLIRKALERYKKHNIDPDNTTAIVVLIDRLPMKTENPLSAIEYIPNEYTYMVDNDSRKEYVISNSYHNYTNIVFDNEDSCDIEKDYKKKGKQDLKGPKDISKTSPQLPAVDCAKRELLCITDGIISEKDKEKDKKISGNRPSKVWNSRAKKALKKEKENQKKPKVYKVVYPISDSSGIISPMKNCYFIEVMKLTKDNVGELKLFQFNFVNKINKNVNSKKISIGYSPVKNPLVFPMNGILSIREKFRFKPYSKLGPFSKELFSTKQKCFPTGAQNSSKHKSKDEKIGRNGNEEQEQKRVPSSLSPLDCSSLSVSPLLLLPPTSTVMATTLEKSCFENSLQNVHESSLRIMPMISGSMFWSSLLAPGVLWPHLMTISPFSIKTMSYSDNLPISINRNLMQTSDSPNEINTEHSMFLPALLRLLLALRAMLCMEVLSNGRFPPELQLLQILPSVKDFSSSSKDFPGSLSERENINIVGNRSPFFLQFITKESVIRDFKQFIRPHFETKMFEKKLFPALYSAVDDSSRRTDTVNGTDSNDKRANVPEPDNNPIDGSCNNDNDRDYAKSHTALQCCRVVNNFNRCDETVSEDTQNCILLFWIYLVALILFAKKQLHLLVTNINTTKLFQLLTSSNGNQYEKNFLNDSVSQKFGYNKPYLLIKDLAYYKDELKNVFSKPKQDVLLVPTEDETSENFSSTRNENVKTSQNRLCDCGKHAEKKPIAENTENSPRNLSKRKRELTINTHNRFNKTNSTSLKSKFFSLKDNEIEHEQTNYVKRMKNQGLTNSVNAVIITEDPKKAAKNLSTIVNGFSGYVKRLKEVFEKEILMKQQRIPQQFFSQRERSDQPQSWVEQKQSYLEKQQQLLEQEQQQSRGEEQQRGQQKERHQRRTELRQEWLQLHHQLRVQQQYQRRQQQQREQQELKQLKQQQAERLQQQKESQQQPNSTIDPKISSLGKSEEKENSHSDLKLLPVILEKTDNKNNNCSEKSQSCVAPLTITPSISRKVTNDRNRLPIPESTYLATRSSSLFKDAVSPSVHRTSSRTEHSFHGLSASCSRESFISCSRVAASSPWSHNDSSPSWSQASLLNNSSKPRASSSK